MNLDLIKYLTSNTPNWLSSIFLIALWISLILPTFIKVYGTIQASKAKKQKEELKNRYRDIFSYQDENFRSFLEEQEAEERFYNETGIRCNKNLRDGLNWLRRGSGGSGFSWRYLRTSINYLREEDGRFGVKVPWLSVVFEKLWYAYATFMLVSAGFFCFLILNYHFKSSQQKVLVFLIITILFCLILAFSFGTLNFPVGGAREIAKAVRRRDPDNPFLEIPKLFDPIYGGQSSIIKPHYIEQLKRLSSHLKHMKRPPRKN
ncbi:MAG: hypothetical protein JOZ78_13165 [Chroococcidiopsidaceae cyanobacterium CP_BM_ER_R8_30]|nr:hypothetical protein [Chroococcidiopsidaceae cyanobacterium CP_BM_ER_R8_30]